MKTEEPVAGDEAGQANPDASTDAPVSSRPDDEALRRYAVARLADHLDVGVSLAQRCEQLSGIPDGDRVGAITAAARLMNANARVAEALATVAQVERRRRSIVETVPKAEGSQLNSRFDARKFSQSKDLDPEAREKLWRRMSDWCNQSIRARMGDPASRDVIMEKIKEAKWDHEKAQETFDELDREEAGGA
jgi:hypothetical protein